MQLCSLAILLLGNRQNFADTTEPECRPKCLWQFVIGLGVCLGFLPFPAEGFRSLPLTDGLAFSPWCEETGAALGTPRRYGTGAVICSPGN